MARKQGEGRSLLLKNGRERIEYGCTTTWKNATGETVCVSRKGAPQQVLRDVAEAVTDLDGTYRLIGYSTPETIYRDLTRPDSRLVPSARTPESVALGLIGRHDLLHPDAPSHITATWHHRSYQ